MDTVGTTTMQSSLISPAASPTGLRPWASPKAIVLDPGKAFYVSLFGTIKRGAIAVPLFTLFGPEGLALRINDCQPRLILTQQRAEALSAQFSGATVVEVNDAFWAELATEQAEFTPTTGSADLA